MRLNQPVNRTPQVWRFWFSQQVFRRWLHRCSAVGEMTHVIDGKKYEETTTYQKEWGTADLETFILRETKWHEKS
jgi:hypothetical protein